MATYITGAELTAYASARGITLTDDPDKLVIRAQDYVDGSNFIGTKTDPLQPMEWPRENAYFKGVLIDDDVIPDYTGGGSVIKMAYETAIAIDQGSDPTAIVDNSIKREKKKVDTLEKEIEYTDQGQEAVVSQKITRAASGLIDQSNNGIAFTVFN